MRNEETVLANHLRQEDARVFADPVGDQVIVKRFLGVARPAHEPAHVARRERVRVLGTEIARRIERAVGNHHLHRHAAARDRRIQLVAVLHADSRTAGEHARAARRSAVRDAQLRVLAVRHDVLGVELSIGHHLRQRHHRCRIRPDGVGGDHIDVGVFGCLRRSDAAVDPNRLLSSFDKRCHVSLRAVHLLADANLVGQSAAADCRFSP